MMDYPVASLVVEDSAVLVLSCGQIDRQTQTDADEHFLPRLSSA